MCLTASRAPDKATDILRSTNMKKVQQLEEQIAHLKELINLKDQIIEALKVKQQLAPITITPYISPAYPSIPYYGQNWRCIDRGGVCNYPTMWGGTTPPACTNCGMSMAGSTVTLPYSGSISTTSVVGTGSAGGYDMAKLISMFTGDPSQSKTNGCGGTTLTAHATINTSSTARN